MTTFPPAASVSVVISALSDTAALRRAIDSCLAQTRPENVFIVFDGAQACMDSLAPAARGAHPIALGARRGASACRNHGLGLVATDYVMFLDHEDHIEAPLLHSAAQAADAAEADMVLGRFRQEAQNGARQDADPRQIYGHLSNASILKQWLLDRSTPPCAIVWRAAFLRALGGWDEDLAEAQHADLVYRALLSGAKPACCAQGRGAPAPNAARGADGGDAHRLGSRLRVLDKIRDALPYLSYDPSRELAHAYYELARLAYSRGQDALGHAAEDASRSLGLDGQVGPLSHRFAAALLGLGRKQKLARFVKFATGA